MGGMVQQFGQFGSRILSLGAVLVLFACGGGGGPTTPETAPGTLATTAGVEAHLAVVSGRAPVPLATPGHGLSNANPPLSRSPFAHLVAGHAGPSVVALCSSSGTRDEMQASRDVDSPYLDAAMLVTRVAYDRCVDSAGPPDDPEGASLEVHGVEEFAQASISQGTVTYVVVGEPQTSQMREFRYRSTFTGQLHEEESIAVGRIDRLDDATFDVDMQTRWNETIDIRFDGATSASGSYRLGNESAPFHISRQSGGWEFLLEGEYQFNAGRCNPDPATVATDRRLVYDDGMNRFVDGMLTFTSAQGLATAVFNADGTVTLMDTRGRTTTIDWPVRFAPWDGNACFQP